MIDMTKIYNHVIKYRNKLTILSPKFKKTYDIREKTETNEGDILIQLSISQQPKALVK